MKDKKTILQSLRTNARAQLTYLAYKAEMPISTAFNKLKELESSIIKKHTSLVNFKELGYESWMQIAVKVDKKQREELKKFALEHKNINSLFEINSGYDFLMEVVHKDRKEFADFMEEMKEKFAIKQTIIIDVVKDVKREEFLTE